MKIHLSPLPLIGSLLLLSGCPDQKTSAPETASEATPAASVTPTPPAAAAARRSLQPATTTEVRAGWALKACAAGCTERQEAIATRLSAAAQLVPLTRDEKAVGLQLIALRAYSPWIACRLVPGDLVTAVGAKEVREDADIPAVIRACTLGEALTVERRGEKILIPARGEAKDKAAEALPPGTRDLP